MGAHAAPKGRAGRSRRAELAQQRSLHSRQKGSFAARVFVGAWVLYGFMVIQSGVSNHLTIAYYLYSVLFWIMLPVAGITVIVLAERLAAASTKEPQRWAYWVLALCFLSPIAVTVAEMIRLHGQRPSWVSGKPLAQAASELVILCVVWSAMLALLAIGRAVFKGRMRERCWLCPPYWLTDRQ
jgi:hypothetical protein